MSVAAVVVSYNRRELLRKCLSAVLSQSHAPDEVILVDNGSTDGAVDMVREEFPSVRVFETGENLGGAGGFAWGLELAIAAGHEFAWLMDDDAEPVKDSLAPLVAVYANADQRPAFAAPIVDDFEGHANGGHVHEIDLDASKQLIANQLGCIAIDHATFIGVLIDLTQARSVPLPRADFFIWFDDVEYTRGLGHSTYGVCVPSSRIMHPVKSATNPDMGGRLFYFVRNRLWLARLNPGRRGVPDSVPYVALELFAYALLKQLPHAKDKALWARSLGRGLTQGFLRTPRSVMPGELLSTRS